MTGSSLTRYDGPKTTDEVIRYAGFLAGGGERGPRNEVLPGQFRGNAAAVMFAVEYARALDVSPITALTGIHVVDGKPTASAGLISALIRRAGHQLRVSLEGSYEAGDLKAVATVIRTDDPDHPYRSEWTLERARRAMLVRVDEETGRYVAAKPRSAWDTYPEAMLKARAITEVGRDAAEDALLGVHYTPEELGADVDERGEVVTATVEHVDQPPSRGRSPAAEARTAPQEPQADASRPNTPSGDSPPAEEPAKPAEEHTAAQAQADALAEAALECADVEELRGIYKDVVAANLGEADVTGVIVVDDARELEPMPNGPVRLGSLLMRVSAYFAEKGRPVRIVEGEVVDEASDEGGKPAQPMPGGPDPDAEADPDNDPVVPDPHDGNDPWTTQPEATAEGAVSDPDGAKATE